MKNRNPKTDEYIKASAEFAKPILTHLRKLIHEVCPDVEETIKWGMPAFEYKGPMCSMASFKAHCAFGFWKESLMSEIKELKTDQNYKYAMGSLGKIEKMSDLPSDAVLKKLIGEAVRLNKEDIKLPPKKKHSEKELQIPDYFLKAIKANKKTLETFENFSYSNKKEYVEWVTDAKTEETRESRLKTAVQWMSEGKIRHWKYMSKK